MKLNRQQWQMIIALLLVAVISTVLLGVANILTRAPIAQAERQALMSALMQVLPEHQNDPVSDTRKITLPGHTQATHFYFSRNQKNDITGIAWQVTAPDGYNGSIHILMAVRPNGSIHAIRITRHKETPGLGDGITKNQPWLDSFADQSLDEQSLGEQSSDKQAASNKQWAVKKDGGDFDQFTGATITPRAVVKAVKKGLEMFTKLKSALLKNNKSEAFEGKHAQ
ncbi:MAG: RnfABCDGE type electron transport complex subunit G [Mariprofundaceae bacterium]|nr:RnfABCDGE type electron transport complex subunit G [Mariprofundaceae bacterium]